MSWGAVIVGGAALATTAISADASRKASNKVARAAKSDLDLQEKMWSASREDLAPFRDIELEANRRLLDEIKAGPGRYEESDAYKFQLGQGLDAIGRSAIAGGVSRNADTMKFASGLASQDYGNWYNRWLSSLSPLGVLAGKTATLGTVGANQGLASGAGRAYGNMGSAGAAGDINTANSYTSGINNALNNYMAYSQLSPLQAGRVSDDIAKTDVSQYTKLNY